SQGGVLVTESGIPAATPTTKARTYVDTSAGHDTGIALASPGRALNVSLRAFRTDGSTPVGSPATVTLAPFGHKAALVNQLVTDLPAQFTGVVEMSSTVPFAALTLRSLTNARGNLVLTTFPIADGTRLAPAPIVFPQVAVGNGYATEFILLGANGGSSVTL